MNQATLFPSYPDIPAYRNSDTSLEAAQSIDAPRLRGIVLDTLTLGSCTADECAELNGISVLAVRPRFSELRKMNRIVDTGMRRKNASGKNAIVWKLI